MKKTQNIRTILAEWFDRYVGRYRSQEGLLPFALELKYGHSHRVAENARLIAEGIGLAPDDVQLAYLCGLLHDIGRFIQHERYGSFRDADTLDHGLAGRQVLEEENLSSCFSPENWMRMVSAVEYHNRKTNAIPAGLSAKTQELLNIIRDADKLDIMDLVLQSVARDGFRDLPDMLPHIRLSRELTPAVLEEFQKNKTISTDSLATVTDFLVMLATWFYDFNYAPSRRLAVSSRMIERLEKELPDAANIRRLLDDIKSICPAHEGEDSMIILAPDHLPRPVITVICDNYTTRDDLEASWGFACLIALEGKNILFDTGSDGPVLRHNMEKLDIDPASIDLLMISHQHWDHVGGIYEILSARRDLPVYVPRSFSIHFQDDMKRYGASITDIDGPREILPGLFTTGEMQGLMPEQSALLQTEAGTVVITGCAHPGIVRIVEAAQTILPEDEIALVMGGFHLLGDNDHDILEIIGRFKSLGVRHAAASHCSGERARELFAREYGERFIFLGSGTEIFPEDFKKPATVLPPSAA